ncbi:MAG: HD-GYP domain-containing protein [Kordiimonas sp.]
MVNKGYNKACTDCEFAKDLLLGMMEMSDPYTVEHSKEVMEIACSIGKIVNLDNNSISRLKYAALFHDIGKQAIPPTILSKPYKLCEEEFRLIQTHVTTAATFLHKVKLDPLIIRYVTEHHERLDGTGYPHGLKGQEISIEGQILGIADVISAITSKRSYRMPLSIKGAIQHLAENSPHKFSSELVDAAAIALDLTPNAPPIPNSKTQSTKSV